MTRALMMWLQQTCCIGQLWVQSHWATHNLLHSSMDLTCCAEMASSSQIIGDTFEVSALSFLSRFSSRSQVALKPSWWKLTNLISCPIKLLLNTWWLLRHIRVIWRQFDTHRATHCCHWRQCFHIFSGVKEFLVQIYSPPSVYIFQVSLTYLTLKKKVFRWSTFAGRQQVHMSGSWVLHQYRQMWFVLTKFLICCWLESSSGAVCSLWGPKLWTGHYSWGDGLRWEDFLWNMLPECVSSHLLHVEAGPSGEPKTFIKVVNHWILCEILNTIGSHTIA